MWYQTVRGFWTAQFGFNRVQVDPHHESSMSIMELRLLFHVRMVSHLLLVEQGRLARPGRHDIYVAAHLAPPRPCVMSGTAVSTVRVSAASD